MANPELLKIIEAAIAGCLAYKRSGLVQFPAFPNAAFPEVNNTQVQNLIESLDGVELSNKQEFDLSINNILKELESLRQTAKGDEFEPESLTSAIPPLDFLASPPDQKRTPGALGVMENLERELKNLRARKADEVQPKQVAWIDTESDVSAGDEIAEIFTRKGLIKPDGDLKDYKSAISNRQLQREIGVEIAQQLEQQTIEEEVQDSISEVTGQYAEELASEQVAPEKVQEVFDIASQQLAERYANVVQVAQIEAQKRQIAPEDYPKFIATYSQGQLKKDGAIIKNLVENTAQLVGANKNVQQQITDQVINRLAQVKPVAANWQIQISTDEPRIFAQNKDQSFEFVPRILSPEALQDKAAYEISQAGITTIINNPEIQIPLENLDPQKIANEVEQFYKEAFEGAGQPPTGLPPAPPSGPDGTEPTPPEPTPSKQQTITTGQGQKIQPVKEGFKGLSTPQEIATKYLGIPFIGAAFGPAGLIGAAGIGQTMALNKKIRKAEAQIAFLFRPDLKWKKILKDKRNAFLAENLIYKPTKAILEKLLPYDKELYVYRKGGRAIVVEETIFKPFHKFGQGLAANLESRALKTRSAGLSFGLARAARTLKERRRRTSPWGAIGGLIVADLAGGFVESYLTRKALWAMKTVRIANHALKGAASLNTGAGFLLGSAIGGPIGGVIGAGVGASYQVALNITNNKNFLIKGRALAPLRAMQKNPLLRPNLAKGAAVGAILVFGGGPIWLVPLFAGSQYLWGSVRPWAAPWVETKSWNLATKGKYVSLKQFTSSNPIKGRAFASIKHGGYGLAAGAVFAFASGQWYLIPLLALGSFGTSWGIRTGGYYLGRFFSSAGSKVGTKLGVDVASATAKFAGPKLLIAKGLSFFTGIGAVFGIFDLARVVARWGVEQTSVDYETFKKKAWFGEYSRWQWHAYRFFFKAVLAVLNVILWPWDKFWNFIFSTPIFGSILSTFGSWLISGSSFVLRGIGGFFNTVGLGKIGGLFEGAANLISGGAKAIGGAILGFISGVLTLLLGGNVAEAAFSAAIGMVMTGAVLNQAVIGDAFFLDRDVVEESFETQNQFFSVDKAMGIASLGIDASKTITIKNEDLPRDVTIVVQIITRDKPLTNISCRDTATLFAEDGSTFTVFETNGNACPSELGANQTFTFNYPRPQDGSFTLRDENRFEDSTVINRFEMTAATDEGPTPPGSSTASITIGNPPASCPSGWPTQPGNVSQGPFGATSHSRLAQSGELALDIGAGIGTPIISTFDGTVVFAQTSNAKTGYGTQVRIQGNCNDQGFMAIFGHMQAIHASVKEGQPVSRGQLIGWVDHTGYVEPEGPGGSHLHYSFIGLSPMNPPYIPKEVLQNCDNGRGPVCNTTVP